LRHTVARALPLSEELLKACGLHYAFLLLIYSIVVDSLQHPLFMELICYNKRKARLEKAQINRCGMDKFIQLMTSGFQIGLSGA
jgi:hypothetical protein